VYIDENSPSGVFTKFFGMILIEYPDLNDLPQNSGWSHKFFGHDNEYKARGWFKIPQSVGLLSDTNQDNPNGIYPPEYITANNNAWRREYQEFSGGSIYSVAQFYPTKWGASGAGGQNFENSFTNSSGVGYNYAEIAGAWFKTAGLDWVVQSEQTDNQNYLVQPYSGSSTTPTYYKYNFSPNVVNFNSSLPAYSADTFFGGQWLNFCLMFPQYGWSYGNHLNYADVYHNDFEGGSPNFVTDNQQKIFAGLVNTKFLLKGDAFQTAFINLPKLELSKLLQVDLKGINVTRWNGGSEKDVNGYKNQFDIQLTPNYYKYAKVKERSSYFSSNTDGRTYNAFGWDEWDRSPNAYTYPYNTYISSTDNRSAYLFKGMYGNDCIKMLSDFGVI